MRSILKENNKAYANLVPLVLAVIIVFALLFIGGYINGTIHTELEDAVDGTTGTEGKTISTINNVSGNFDSTLDIVQVVVIITILAAAIGAIFLFTRFR